MKKITLFASILLFLGMLTSCLRSDDWELLRHPIHVTGSANPQYGIPVVTGELNINDLMSSFSADYAGMITDDEIVTIEYQIDLRDTILALSEISLKGNKPAPPEINNDEPKFWIPKDTTLVDTIDIDFFNDVDYVGQINIEHLWLKLKVGASGEGASWVNEYVKARFFNLNISYEDHYGVVKQFGSLPGANVEVTDIYAGFDHLFDSVDIQRIANDMPRRIFASYTFRFSVSSDLITSQIMTMPYSEILDSIHMTKLMYYADLHLTMPLSVQFNGLNYSYPISLGDGMSSLNLDSIMSSLSSDIHFDMDSARFRLTLNNGIPLAMTLSATMQDANGINIIRLFNNELINPANVGSNPDNPSQYVAISPKETVIETLLKNNDIDNLHLARTLNVKLKVDSENKHVCIRRSDKLGLKGFLIVKPTMDIDIPVTNGGLIK